MTNFEDLLYFDNSSLYLYIVVKTYNTKLIFSCPEDKILLVETLNLKQQAANIISKIRFDMKTCNGIMPLHQRSYKLIKEQLPTLPSQYIIKAEQDVIAKYKTIRKNKHKINEAVTFSKLSTSLDKRIYKFLDDNRIKLTTHDKRIVCEFETYTKLNEMLSKYKLRDPSVFVTQNNDVYVSLVFDDTLEFIDNNKAIGIDLGLKRLVATSDGTIIKGNEFNKQKRKIRWNKRKFQSKKNNSHSSRKKLKSLRKKEANFSKNYIHHVVNNLLKSTDVNTFVIEDLSKIKSKNKGKRFNNRLSQVPFYKFKEILIYKAQSLGKRVEMVKPYFTSQNDHRGIESGKRVGCRYYSSDGVVLDADVNAAINILQRSQNKHSNSSCKGLDGQVTVNSPIVGINSGKPKRL
jgi:IS605 OrfB family transposase